MDRCPDQSPEEPKPKLTVGDIFRAGAAAYRREYGHTLTVEQDRALREIPGCRKALFGGRMHECKKCGHEFCPEVRRHPLGQDRDDLW